jgi:predicted nucleotide-binding protein (sugar kinase/HSP70/actin superfamily)
VSKVYFKPKVQNPSKKILIASKGTPLPAMKSMNEIFTTTMSDYSDNNVKMATLQISTINKMNDAMLEHYKKVEENIILVSNESQETNSEYEVLEDYFSKIDKISSNITS